MPAESLSLTAQELPIEVPGEPSETLSFAADQLSYYLAIITGRRFPVGRGPGRIRLSCAMEGPEGSYEIRVLTDGVELRGTDDLALLHAVYEFLETKCGCRWLAAFEGDEIVPRIEDLSVPLCSERREPACTHRAFTNFPDIDRRTVRMVDWMCKNRFNRFMVFANVQGAFDRYREILKPHLALRGMKVEMGHHSFRYWLPPQEFFSEHPEWYAQIGGKRVPDGQLCTSNATVSDTVADRICEFLDGNPEIDLIGLWPNDGYGWCECSQCAKLEPQRPSAMRPPQLARTDTYIEFVNRVARRVHEAHPDKRLSALAYVNYVEPPTLDLAENVDVCYAAMNRCFKHPFYGGAECTRENARYAEYFDQWRQRVPGSLYLFCYLMLIDMCSVPYDITGMLGPNFRWLAEHGCDGYVMEFKPDEWGPFGVNGHLIGRLSWDPDLDVDAWLAGYYADLYGPAAPQMLAFHKAYQDRFVAPGPCVYHYDLTYTRRATRELLLPALEHLGRARALAATGEKRHRQALERAHLGIELLMRMGRWQRAHARAQVAEGPKKAVLTQQAVDLAEDLVAWANNHSDTDAIFAPRIEMMARRAIDALQS